MSETQPSSGGPAGDDRAHRASKIGLAALGAAVVASACCWLPLLTLALGLGGGAAAAAFQRWRPITLPLTFLLLALAWFLALRRPGAGTCSTGACAPTGARRSRSRLGLLGLVTLLALAAAFFPELEAGWYGGARDQRVESAPGARLEFEIRGMTCEGCAASVARAIRETEGVEAADVSLETERAVVRLAPDAQAAKTIDAIVEAVRRAGYEARPVGSRQHGENR